MCLFSQNATLSQLLCDLLQNLTKASKAILSTLDKDQAASRRAILELYQLLVKAALDCIK